MVKRGLALAFPHGSTKEEPMNATIIFALLAVIIGGVVAQVVSMRLVEFANMFPS